MKLLFLHGTGVRKESFDETFDIVKAMAGKALPELSVHPCYWGGEYGSRLGCDGASIPNYDQTRAVAQVPDGEDSLIALWAMLYQDPLFECRLLLLEGGKSSPFGRESPEKKAILVKFDNPLSNSEAGGLGGLLRSDTEKAAFTAAAKWVAEQTEFRAFLKRANDLMQIGATIGRAVVGRMVADAANKDESSRFGMDAAARDELVTAIDVFLFGKARGLLGSVLTKVLKPLEGIASNIGARRRGGLMDGASPAVGDVLHYQADGLKLRDFIRDQVRQLNDSVILMAHSLGGIACVEMLIEQELPEVKLFVTAGSQSPYFYEIGALRTLPFKANVTCKLPAHFPKWVNFYDRRDFLSFVGRGVFGAKVTDKEVNNGQPFPQSHSAYWSNDAVWKTIKECL
jgi:hypothetical protein